MHGAAWDGRAVRGRRRGSTAAAGFPEPMRASADALHVGEPVAGPDQDGFDRGDRLGGPGAGPTRARRGRATLAGALVAASATLDGVDALAVSRWDT